MKSYLYKKGNQLVLKNYITIKKEKLNRNYFTLIIILFVGFKNSKAQSLGRIGNAFDITTTSSAGTVLMGGGSDVDAAFTWMINKSGGGDFVIIRATGGSGYNSYIYGLGVANSVETFLVNSTTLANDSSIVQAIRKAEAVFFAGGNQNDYITYYNGTALGTIIDYLANEKHVPIGGTSAGMAIQGYIYYDGVTNVLSQEALQNPYASATGIHYNDFLHNPFLTNTICETHFNAKGGTTSNGITGRQGRLMSFLARMIKDQSMADVKAIACDEKTAVCIDENGIAMVVGINKAYFLRQWCAIPETCITGTPLDWTNGTKVYIINGPGSYTAAPSISRSINLNDWVSVQGGFYNYWTVDGGLLTIAQTTATPNLCTTAIATYIFNGNGNWSNPFNWLNSAIPPSNVTTSFDIIIDPIIGGECFLNITSQKISHGAKIIVRPGKNFRVAGNLSIQ